MFKFFRLKPREDKFRKLLDEMSVQAHDCARHLKTFLDDDDEAARVVAGLAIAQCKAAAKILSLQVTKELCRTYITPFDREDIQAFSVNLYRIPKIVEKIKERMVMHRMTGLRGAYSAQADIIVEQADVLRNMVLEIIGTQDTKTIVAKAGAMDILEQRGDTVFGALLVALFEDKTDVRDILLRKDLYDLLEKVIDAYRDVSGVALQIVLKHS